MKNVLVIAGGLLAALTFAACVGAAEATPPETLATVVSSGTRAVLVAQMTGGGAAPTARVTLTTYARANGGWVPLRNVRVAGTYFWKVLAAPHAVCRFELSTASTGAVRPHVTVQLLVTPSIGCGKAQTVGLPLD